MSLSAIRDEYHVPARYGARVELASCVFSHGTVKGSRDNLILVDFDNGDRAAIPVSDLRFLPACTCFPVPERYWTTHYGAIDPATMFEPNPECRDHFPENFHPTTEEN